MLASADFEKALAIGRPPNIQALFPNSRALIVSGKVIDRGLMKKGQSLTMAANGRNHIVIRGALMAAQAANSAMIIEIAKSEGGTDSYCAVNYWNMARQVDALMNELGVTVPVAVHADHYGIKKDEDIKKAQVEIPTMFEAGITSIAIDASHLPDADNLLASIHLNLLVPKWAGLETEIGEIKGKESLSTVEEALFFIQGLNAHSIFPNWIALNNGTAHGIQSSDLGIQVELTKQIHEALAPYHISGAQHGTSGNDSACLRRIAAETRTTKANVATTLQMISWGVKVNDYGNAELDDNGEFVKLAGRGVSSKLWEEMKAAAKRRNFKAGDYKNLNLLFENKILSQPRVIRDRMTEGVRDFVYQLLTEVFNAKDSAPMAIEAILEVGTYDLGPNAKRIEDSAQWTEDKIRAKAGALNTGKGRAGGNFED
jgi:fructose/tagatose bisphosphate aldolase